MALTVQLQNRTEYIHLTRPTGWIFGLIGLIVGAAGVGVVVAQGHLPFTQTRPDATISRAEMRRLSTRELAERAFGMAAASVVETGRLPTEEQFDQLDREHGGAGVDRSLDQVVFAMPPESSNSGLCEAKIVSVHFEAVADNDTLSEDSPFRFRNASIRSVYKVAGKLERGQVPSPEMVSRCARWRPFSNGHFTADSSQDAFDAGRIFQVARAEMDADGVSFAVGCKIAGQCRDRRALLRMLDVARIVSVGTLGCDDDVDCLEITFLTGAARRPHEAPALSMVRATTFYRVEDGSAWGQLWIKSLEFDDLS